MYHMSSAPVLSFDAQQRAFGMHSRGMYDSCSRGCRDKEITSDMDYNDQYDIHPEFPLLPARALLLPPFARRTMPAHLVGVLS